MTRGQSNQPFPTWLRLLILAGGVALGTVLMYYGSMVNALTWISAYVLAVLAFSYYRQRKKGL